MYYVIQLEHAYVKSGKEDTPDIKKAKRFPTEDRAKKFIYAVIGADVIYTIIPITE